jgi:HK97 family phage major capsid protein
MPAVAANSFSIAFGDWRRAYTIADRKGMTLIMDRFSNKPYVGAYTVKRVGAAARQLRGNSPCQILGVLEVA